ncbi:MAG: MetQ/NlpA family ABC transporter substrate-binding protein [Anaeromassilibacillus sp.]
MKKIFALILAVALSATVLAGCQSGGDAASGENADNSESKVIKVGASPAPHAEILEVASDILKEQGYELDVVEILRLCAAEPGALEGELDANYFQHQTYLDNFNEEYGTELASISAQSMPSRSASTRAGRPP